MKKVLKDVNLSERTRWYNERGTISFEIISQ